VPFDAHPGSGDFVTRPAVHVIQNIRRAGGGDSRGLWPVVPDTWQPRFSSVAIRGLQCLRLMIIMVSPTARPTVLARRSGLWPQVFGQADADRINHAALAMPTVRCLPGR
jgi:hypothetical protein